MKALTNPALRNDLLLVAGLVALDVTARLLPHAPNFTPIAASALFAGTVLRHKTLAFVVPILALVISDAVLGYDIRPTRAIIYALFLLPALIGYLPTRLRSPGMFAPVIVSYSLLFFVVTNFAVWAFSTMYPHTWAGLWTCYAAGLPYLPQSIIGDLFWSAVLFGGASLLGLAPLGSRRTA